MKVAEEKFLIKKLPEH